MSHRNPGLQNPGCGGGCCNNCVYLCFVDGSCQTSTWASLKLCATDGTTYTGNDPAKGASATATFSQTGGWTVSYSCPGSSNTYSFGAGKSLPQSYEDPSSGWYVALSSSPVGCVGSGLLVDCLNCIQTIPATIHRVFATLSGWSLCGVSFDGTYPLGYPFLDYAGPIVPADPAFCTQCATDGGVCYMQLRLHLQCAGVNGGYQADWTNQIITGPNSGSPCYAPPKSFPCFGGGQGKLDTGVAMLGYGQTGGPNFGACNFHLDTGAGAVFHL